MTAATDPVDGLRWLLLIYQFPQGSGSRRVKIWRRLQDIGAIAIKNSVYVLPFNEQTQEDFAWIQAELSANGADAALLEGAFIGGMDDAQVQALFNAARNAEYTQVAQEAQEVETALSVPDGAPAGALDSARRSLQSLRRRFGQIEALDYFAAAGQDSARAAVQSLEAQLAAHAGAPATGGQTMKSGKQSTLQNRVWVTRRNVRVDRIASAWLIRRWIDPAARFKFVASNTYRPAEGEVRFDMFDAEFTHDGDRCTFEVLVGLLEEAAPALQAIAEIVHDIDLRDGKFARPETDGIASLLSGLAAGTVADDDRLEQGAALFENLYAHFEVAAR